MHNSIDIRMVGETIKQLRLSRNWTQDRLADAAGYSVRNLRRIENDGTASLDVVNTFAEIFQVSAVDILKGCLLFLSAGFRKTKKDVASLRHTVLTPICYSYTCAPG